MTIAWFSAVYFYLTYAWWLKYADGTHIVPKIRTGVGYVLLVLFGIGAVESTSILLCLAGFSAILHFRKHQWNPFHSGFVAGTIAAVFIAGSATFQGGSTQWLQQTGNAAVTSLISGTVMAVATYATIGRRNPLQYIAIRAGLREKQIPAVTRPHDRSRPSATLSGQQADNGVRQPSQPSPEEQEINNGNEERTNRPASSNSEVQETAGGERQKAEPVTGKRADDTEDAEATDSPEDNIEEFDFPWEEPPETRFGDIGGYNGVKEELQERVVAPLKDNSESYERFNVEPSRGILFHGPPGTGKTLFARALANELGRPFVELNQSDLTHEYVNKSPQIISRLFEEAQYHGGVIFIDEAEQLLGDRSQGMNAHKEDQKITNTFLSALTKEDQDFLVLLTTNRRDKMDEAILRPGRIDEEIEIGMPDGEARLEILKVKLAEIPHKLKQHQVETIAGETNGWSGADLNNLVNRAKINAAERGARFLKLEDINAGYEDIRRPDKE